MTEKNWAEATYYEVVFYGETKHVKEAIKEMFARQHAAIIKEFGPETGAKVIAMDLDIFENAQPTKDMEAHISGSGMKMLNRKLGK